MYRHCGCPECWDREQREISYRVRREMDYELRWMQYQSIPQMRIGIDATTTDGDKTGVTQMVTMPYQPIQINEVWQRQVMGRWDINAMQQLMAGDEPKKENNMGNVVKRIKALGLSKEDKLLRKYQIVDTSGDLTTDGKEALWNILLTENKSALVEKLTELEADEKKKR